MVKILPKTFPDGPGRFYEITVPVGQPRGDNTNTDRRDTQLVQFFLRVFYRVHPELLPRIPGRTGFLIDGKTGTQTIEGIRRFQRHVQKSNFPVFDDSRVSVAQGVFVPGTHTGWTINFLNAFARGTLGPKAFDNLFSNAEINAEAPELTINLIQQELLNAPL